MILESVSLQNENEQNKIMCHLVYARALVLDKTGTVDYCLCAECSLGWKSYSTDCTSSLQVDIPC